MCHQVLRILGNVGDSLVSVAYTTPVAGMPGGPFWYFSTAQPQSSTHNYGKYLQCKLLLQNIQDIPDFCCYCGVNVISKWLLSMPITKQYSKDRRKREVLSPVPKIFRQGTSMDADGSTAEVIRKERLPEDNISVAKLGYRHISPKDWRSNRDRSVALAWWYLPRHPKSKILLLPGATILKVQTKHQSFKDLV